MAIHFAMTGENRLRLQFPLALFYETVIILSVCVLISVRSQQQPNGTEDDFAAISHSGMRPQLALSSFHTADSHQMRHGSSADFIRYSEDTGGYGDNNDDQYDYEEHDDKDIFYDKPKETDGELSDRIMSSIFTGSQKGNDGEGKFSKKNLEDDEVLKKYQNAKDSFTEHISGGSLSGGMDYNYDYDYDYDHNELDENRLEGDVINNSVGANIKESKKDGGSGGKDDSKDPTHTIKSKIIAMKPEPAAKSSPSSSSSNRIQCAIYDQPKPLGSVGRYSEDSLVDEGGQEGEEGGSAHKEGSGKVWVVNATRNTSWELGPVNYTIKLCEPQETCYTMWMTDPDQENKLEVKSQGCWMKIEESDCQREACLSEVSTVENTHFCCCYSDLCNTRLTVSAAGGYRLFQDRSTPSPAVVSTSVAPLIDNSYRAKTIIIALVSVCCVALIVILIYLPYRLCLNHKPLFNSPISSGESGGQTASTDRSFCGYLPVADMDWDLLKFDEMLFRGQFSEVWRGSMGSQELAVKVYQSKHQQYYYNECNCYTLPFMEHENLVKFYGARESQRGGDQGGTAESSPDSLDTTTTIISGSGSNPSGGSGSGGGGGGGGGSCGIGGGPTGGYRILLEYHPLGSLMDYLKTHTLDWSQLFSMGQDIARGLAHLHNEVTHGDQFKPALVHRDLNTRNILVTSDLQCVLTDLGFGTAIKGSRILKNGTLESSEQATLAEVGTVRYLAPEAFEGAVNLRECEASLKQVDVYSLGLVLWELASRCVHLYQGAPIPEYQLPFHAEAGPHPNFAQMQSLVVRHKTRPKFPQVWKDSNPAVRTLKETIEDCWDTDPEARLTALCVQERFSDMTNLWVQGSRLKGVHPSLHTTKNVSGNHYQHTVSPNGFISNGMAFLPEFVSVVNEMSHDSTGGNTSDEAGDEERKVITSLEERSDECCLKKKEREEEQEEEEEEEKEVEEKECLLSGLQFKAKGSELNLDLRNPTTEELVPRNVSVFANDNDNEIVDEFDDGDGDNATRPLICRNNDNNNDSECVSGAERNDDAEYCHSFASNASLSGSTIDTWLIPTPSADEENKAIILPSQQSSSLPPPPSNTVIIATSKPSPTFSSNTYPDFHSRSHMSRLCNHQHLVSLSSPSPSTTLTTSPSQMTTAGSGRGGGGSSGLKSSNVNSMLNSTVLHPHQGRNPTFERNTHKSSDEELTVSGNRLIGPGNNYHKNENNADIRLNIDTNCQVLSLLPLTSNTSDLLRSEKVNGNTSNLNLDLSSSVDLSRMSTLSSQASVATGSHSAEPSSLILNDSLHYRHPHQQQQPQRQQVCNTVAPIPYLQNQVSPLTSSSAISNTVLHQQTPLPPSTSSSSSSSSRPKMANVLNGNEVGPGTEGTSLPDTVNIDSSNPSRQITASDEPPTHRVGDRLYFHRPHRHDKLTNGTTPNQHGKSIKERLLSSKPISKLISQTVLRKKPGKAKPSKSHSDNDNGHAMVKTKNKKNSYSPTIIQVEELRGHNHNSTLNSNSDNHGPTQSSFISHRNGGDGAGGSDSGDVIGNGECYNGGLETSLTHHGNDRHGHHKKTTQVNLINGSAITNVVAASPSRPNTSRNYRNSDSHIDYATVNKNSSPHLLPALLPPSVTREPNSYQMGNPLNGFDNGCNGNSDTTTMTPHVNGVNAAAPAPSSLHAQHPTQLVSGFGCTANSQPPLNVMVPVFSDKNKRHHSGYQQNHHQHHQQNDNQQKSTRAEIQPMSDGQNIVRNGGSTSFILPELRSENGIDDRITNRLTDNSTLYKPFNAHYDRNRHSYYQDKNCQCENGVDSKFSSKDNEDVNRFEPSANHNHLHHHRHDHQQGNDKRINETSNSTSPPTSAFVFRNSYPPFNNSALLSLTHPDPNSPSPPGGAETRYSPPVVESCFLPIQPVDHGFISQTSPSIVFPLSNYEDSEFKPSSSSPPPPLPSSSSTSSISSLLSSPPSSLSSLSSPMFLEKKSQYQTRCIKSENQNCDDWKKSMDADPITGNICTTAMTATSTASTTTSKSCIPNPHPSNDCAGSIPSKHYLAACHSKTTTSSSGKSDTSSNSKDSESSTSVVSRRGVSSNNSRPYPKPKARPKSLPIKGYYYEDSDQSSVNVDCLVMEEEEEEGGEEEQTIPKPANVSSKSNWSGHLVSDVESSDQELQQLSKNRLSDFELHSEGGDIDNEFECPASVSVVPNVSLSKLHPSTVDNKNKTFSAKGNKSSDNINNNESISSSSSSSRNDDHSKLGLTKGNVDLGYKVLSDWKKTKSGTARVDKSKCKSEPRSKSLKENRCDKRQRQAEEGGGEEEEKLKSAREKIRRRIKTPVSFRNARLSLYDDRLMSQSFDLDVFGRDNSGGGGSGADGATNGSDNNMSWSVWGEGGASLLAEMRL